MYSRVGCKRPHCLQHAWSNLPASMSSTNCGDRFFALVRGDKKTLKLKVGDIGVQMKVLVPLKEIMACFFSMAESPANTLGPLKQMQKGSGYDFCCLLLPFQSHAMTAKKNRKLLAVSHKGQKKTKCQDGRS